MGDPLILQSNLVVAAHLEEIAALLEAQGANVFRSRAYRLAADAVRTLDRPVIDILQRAGVEGLDELPHVAPTISRVISVASSFCR